jgi:hypothetical protein
MKSTIQIIILLIIIFNSNVNNSFSVTVDTIYSVSFQGFTGVSVKFRSEKIALNNIFFSPGIKILWMPDNLLSIGIESDYIHLLKKSIKTQTSDYGETDFYASMNSVSLMTIFSMKIEDFDLAGGVGISYVTSNIVSFGTETNISNIYYCYTASLCYNFLKYKNFDLGLELKIFTISKLNSLIGGIYLKTAYRIEY